MNTHDCNASFPTFDNYIQPTAEWNNYPTSQWFSWNIGVVIGSAAYGASLTLCILIFMAMRERARQEKRKYGRISTETVWIFVYIFWTLILCSGLLAVETEASLPHPPLPGGERENTYQNMFSGYPTSSVGVACSALIHWAVEILFIWRSYVIYRNSKRTMMLLLSFSGIVFLVSVVSGSMFIIKVATHEYRDAIQLLLLTIFGGTCLASNLIFTHIIAIRLYLYRRHVIKLVGREQAGRYTSIASIFIESGLLMNVILILTLMTIALRSNWVALPLLTFSFVETLSSYVIVLRVALGSAWSSGAVNKLIEQHATAGVHSTNIHSDSPRLSAMRYQPTSQVTQTSTAFRFHHTVTSSNAPGSDGGSESWRNSDVREPDSREIH